ncbi:hypothetical protein [Dactylosporangium matsuzakiense]|uniref:SWIM-type domain-containing protein n=1 Tax=Dactylosporangium matsuzakiense TaxID=53360 RepID=A0A9W6NJ66_9ACTN|nr:hypothetical protein [Dactylosporangium matsuzakiense]UWZ47197.1 PT domain-containing protein [Dactylosporangium matsuzakiense]GLK98361.1 hypothetical protein GCM10017581_001020 [Dactylosporangium matsuzakiense]
MRADVLALTPEALAALTNRGLVKRAAREVEAGPPAVAEDADGTLRATFADGAAPALPRGGLEKAACTCGAVGVCRHVLGLVLAYQAAGAPGPDPAGPAAAPEPWSPGEFTDEQLAGRVGARMLAAARRARKAGYTARVYRPGGSEAAPRVDLGSATVRFLVPHDLGFVHTDAVAGTRDDVIALAVWAFRVADEQAPDQPDVQVDVGDRRDRPETDGLGAAVELASEVLLSGAVHIGGGIVAGLADVRRRLDRDGLRWPLLAVEELGEQLEAYRGRGSEYTPERLAGLLGELHARARAARGLGGGARARLLGTEEAAETPLRRARLDGLGCRVVAAGSEAVGDERRVVEVYLAHADSATVLVLRRAWPGAETGAQLGRRRLAGVSVAQLAAGNLVTESAVRSASRAVRLTASRVAKTTVTASSGAWDRLPDALLVRDLGALVAELDRLPPRVVRPRVEAELVRVLAVAEVREITYSPGAQRIDALLADAQGNVATLTATHTAAAPGRLDALAAALAAGPAFVSGVVRRAGGGIEIDPLAIAVPDRPATPLAGPSNTAPVGPSGAPHVGPSGAPHVGPSSAPHVGPSGGQGGGQAGGARGEQGGGTVVVPDLAEAVGGALGPHWADGRDALRAALDQAIGVVAEVPHRGLRHLPPGFGDRLGAVGDGLTNVGLYRAAEAVGRLRASLGPEPGAAAAEAWVDAHLRLTVTAEMQ